VATTPKPKTRSRISTDLIALSSWLSVCESVCVRVYPEQAKSINKNQLQNKK